METFMTGFVMIVVRIWEHPVEVILASGLPVLPLAPVASD
jgi:hypothetical protein